MEIETARRRVRAARLRIGLGAGVVLVVLLAVVGVLVSALAPHGSTAVAERPREVHTQVPDAAQSPTAVVHVVGQVNSPGIYELPAGSRLVDAVAAAGGFTPGADQSNLNLARVIEDGEQVVVVAQGAASTAGPAGSATTSPTVNINSADATALQTLDGIGPALAQRILAYRTAHGGFRSVGDLQNVPGIGPRKFAAIKPNVTT